MVWNFSHICKCVSFYLLMIWCLLYCALDASDAKAQVDTKLAEAFGKPRYHVYKLILFIFIICSYAMDCS